MALTAQDIQEQTFNTSRHGYDPQEVDVFLEKLATEVENKDRALYEAKNRYEAAEARVEAAERQAKDSLKASSVTEDQISKAFIAAQRSADAMKDEARAEAEKTYREAEARARDIVRDATMEKQRILGEIDRLRESCEKFRTEYLSLLNHFTTDAKKVMPTLDAIKPDTPKAVKESEEFDFISENDAVVAPTPVVPAESQPVFNETAVREPEVVEAAVSYAANERMAGSYTPSSGVQSLSVDLDDDLDIEEID